MNIRPKETDYVYNRDGLTDQNSDDYYISINAEFTGSERTFDLLEWTKILKEINKRERLNKKNE